MTDKEKKELRQKVRNQYGKDLDDKAVDEIIAYGDQPTGEDLPWYERGLYAMAGIRPKSDKQRIFDAAVRRSQEGSKSRAYEKRRKELEDYRKELADKLKNEDSAPTSAPAPAPAPAGATAKEVEATANPPAGNNGGNSGGNSGTQTGGTQTGGTQTGGKTELAGGNRQKPLQPRGVIGGVNPDGTISANGSRLSNTTENKNLVEGKLRQQLLDAPTGVDVTSPLYTNGEVRLMRRRAAEMQDLRDSIARRNAILTAGRKRSDEISWNRGEIRNASDWEHYGTVANTGGDEWKKGGSAYENAMGILQGKMKQLEDLASAGYMPTTGDAMRKFNAMVNDTNGLTGLSQKQIETANKQLNSWIEGASARQKRTEAGNAYRINQLRERMGLAEGTSASDVLAADRAARGKAVSGALEALSDPNVWNGPDYYKHLETIQRNANPNEGLASSFKAAMRDPATRQRYNDAVSSLTGGGMLEDDEGVADLQNKFAIEHMQAQRSAAPTTASPAALTDEEERRLGIQAAQGAGDALRPRRKGVA